MKRKCSYFVGEKQTEREYSYIPFCYILAVLITLFEVLAVVGIVAALCYYVPYFYLAAWATEIFCVILCLAGGALFAVGLGAISKTVLKKTSLV